MVYKLGFVFVLFAVSLLPAHAYIDFGTGSVIIQSIVAGSVGVLFFFKDKIMNLISFLTGKNKDE